MLMVMMMMKSLWVNVLLSLFNFLAVMQSCFSLSHKLCKFHFFHFQNNVSWCAGFERISFFGLNNDVWVTIAICMRARARVCVYDIVCSTYFCRIIRPTLLLWCFANVNKKLCVTASWSIFLSLGVRYFELPQISQKMQ